MAAAALSRSRGVAGVRTTKGLFFIFSLLCLVCLASSLVDKEKLGNIKKDVQKTQQRLESLKEQKASLLEFISEYWSYMDPMTEFVKKSFEGFSEDLPEMKIFLQSVKEYTEAKTYAYEQNEVLNLEIERIEGELEKMMKCINSIEEYQTEL